VPIFYGAHRTTRITGVDGFDLKIRRKLQKAVETLIRLDAPDQIVFFRFSVHYEEIARLLIIAGIFA
jgi:hypothetical protein